MNRTPASVTATLLLARPALARLALALAAGLALPLACQPRSASASDSTAQPGSGGAHLAAGGTPGADPGHAGTGTPLVPAAGDELAAFAEGCFWGSEDTFRHVPGVASTAVGYSGGHTARPTYETVCSHTTGHAETVLVEYDPKKVTYSQLLRVFWDSHDPTTPNQQGPDIGDQYRSEIFTFSPAQESAAKGSLSAEQAQYKDKITTLVQPMGQFWKAEGYHQQYDEHTGRHSCPLPGRKGT